MLGIEDIAYYLPADTVSNYDRKDKFAINNHFIEKKLGIRSLRIKAKDELTSDLCVKAFNALSLKNRIITEEIDTVVVVTQNPDTNIPHTSAIVHAKLNLPESCACFDVSLGCSGYIYALSIIQSFMKDNNFSKGLLFTSDPYSVILDWEDKNTSLLFGDAAAVTLISSTPKYRSGNFTFGTIGKLHKDLFCKNGKLCMNGPAIFNFAAKYIPQDVARLLKANDLSLNDIDKFVFHQGSKYIVDTISRELKLPPAKVIFDAYEYGNTVSSSIPIILSREITLEQNQVILISGFGVGLSWSGNILKRAKV